MKLVEAMRVVRMIAMDNFMMVYFGGESCTNVFYV